MSENNVKSEEKRTLSSTEDGIANIKTEYIVTESEWTSALEDLVNKIKGNGAEKKLDAPKQSTTQHGGQNSSPKHAEKKNFGSITDEDVIATRKEEKKQIQWAGKLALAPLTTLGNIPFRRICKEFGADITCGPMAQAANLLQGNPQDWTFVEKHPSEDIFGVQFCSNNAKESVETAKTLETRASVDFIEFNIGCPIPRICEQGGGCALMERPQVLQSILTDMSTEIRVPLTLKSRTGIDAQILHTVMPLLRDSGVSLVTVHGRSGKMRYTGLADWKYINECAQLVPTLPVFGNGDVFSHHDYNHLLETYSNLAGTTIGRGALIKPWIFTEIKEQRLWDISSTERLDILRTYANYGLEIWGSDKTGVERTRRFLLEWLSFLHRYIPVGILESRQKLTDRPLPYFGRDDLETLMCSPEIPHWIKISEMLLGPAPEGLTFTPKHKSNSFIS